MLAGWIYIVLKRRYLAIRFEIVRFGSLATQLKESAQPTSNPNHWTLRTVHTKRPPYLTLIANSHLQPLIGIEVSN
jgi:hypothetical protein